MIGSPTGSVSRQNQPTKSGLKYIMTSIVFREILFITPLFIINLLMRFAADTTNILPSVQNAG